MNEEKKNQLIESIKTADGLTDDQRSFLLELLREKKPYGLVWEDKPENVEEKLREKLPVLVEDKTKALTDGGPDAPNHVLIEGDNLEALTTLAYTHAGKIDVIYIDPPYNTGNKDFIYNDSFVDSEDSYRHSKWLSFMAKRLRIAQKLLSDCGVIFISIDDNEQANLKLLCDEIFSNLDFIGTIPWRKRTAKSDVPHNLSQDYEWIICYCKNNFIAGIKKETRKYYTTPDFPDRPWRVHDLTKQTSAVERPNSFFTIVNPKTGEQYPANPNRTWAITEETFEEYYRLDRIVFPGDYDFLKISRPVLRYWQDDDRKKAGEMYGFTAVSSNISDYVGMTQDGTKDITAIFGEKAFGFPKPLSLITYLLRISIPIKSEITILDFFAGSGTTLHAVMQLNAEDGGQRQCIMVTNNENGICEKVTYERNKRVINGYITPKGEHVEGLHENNLRYYRSTLIDKDNSHSNRRSMLMALTDVLCFKENIYKEEFQFGDLKLSGKSKMLRFFAENDRKMLIIYDSRVIKFIVNEISKQEKTETPIKIFIYADGMYPYTEDFKGVLEKIELIPMPYAFTHAIKGCIPEAEDKRVDQTELSQQEQDNLLTEATEAEKQDK